ncbi:hypothetical protein [Wolbachia endosymbiont of Oedothorax gibbosus]|uniref:hypothetical protein n=1 Tax=Wolbachia endosymbiont of Oedothorax gibbosus TaxID=931100 RepID=UPI002025B1FB|nr:hypothetical protein [Wolbachia endosymbiont of Oedothorax gibbosus]
MEGLPKKLEKEERDDQYELIKKHLFSLDSCLLMDSKLSFHGVVCTWIACTLNIAIEERHLYIMLLLGKVNYDMLDLFINICNN